MCRASRGRAIFRDIGCADCHRPALRTQSRFLSLSFPEVPTDPSANTYLSIDLSAPPTSFRRLRRGIRVAMFSDLKRHDLGEGLAETTGSPLDFFFVTPRLWGVADSAPYLHDGRAPTLTAAILAHGGEAQQSRDDFEALFDHEREAILAFLRTLRVPRHPNRNLE